MAGRVARLVWVAVDEERAKELRWLIAQMPEEARRWQRVRVLDTLPDLFGA
jgi:hypothetical protein